MASGDNSLPTWQNPSLLNEWPEGQAPSPMAPPGGPPPTPTPTADVQAPTTLPSAAPDLSQSTPQPAPPGPVANQQGLPPAYTGPANRGGPVKNALTRMLYGMGQAMMQHVGLPTDYDIQKQQFNQAIQANDLQLKQAEQQRLQQAQQFQQQTVDTPIGPMPKQTWEKIGPAVYGGILRVQGQEITSRFKSTPNGLFDTWTQSVIPGTTTGATVDSDMVAKYPQLAPLLGTRITPGNLLTANQQQISVAPTVSSSTDATGLTTTTIRHRQLPSTIAAPGGAPGVPGGAPTILPTATRSAAAAGTPTAGAGGTPSQAGGGTLSPAEATLLRTYANSPLMSSAMQLVDSDADPSQYSTRSKQGTVLAALANAYSKQQHNTPYNMAQAGIDYNFAKNVGTQNTLKYLNSLTGPDNKSGNLQTLVNMSNSPDLARTQWPAINDVQAWARLQSGSGPQAAYAATILETADQVGKILQGGQSTGTSDKKLKDAQALFQKGFNTQQIADVAGSLRGLLANRKSELIGNNRYLQRQFGQGGAIAAPAGGQQSVPQPNEQPVYRNGKLLGYTNDGKTITRAP